MLLSLTSITNTAEHCSTTENITTHEQYLNLEAIFELPENEDVNEISIDESTVGEIDDTDMKDETDTRDNIDIMNEETVAEVNNATDTTPAILNADNLDTILYALQKDPKYQCKWLSYSSGTFSTIVKDLNSVKATMTKHELTICLQTIKDINKDLQLHFCKAWTKDRLVQLFLDAVTTTAPIASNPAKRQKRKSPDQLKNLTKKVIKTFPKSLLNVIEAEHRCDLALQNWRKRSPFIHPTVLCNYGSLSWFSMPEYNSGTSSYIFSFLDVHHLITNCRIKVCKDGIPEPGIHKQAWIDVAKSNTTNLKLPHVEDLIDKQSDSIARQTFSKEVEDYMRTIGYHQEASLCSLIREFYEAEDEPGISAIDRCTRRLRLREWLLQGVNFCTFPPYGTHIRGIPNIMFQGFLTNIERRIQLFPFVKSGSYNARSLGSLEVENFFGEFQDLDPKGSGVIKADEVPNALETACQLMKTQLMPDRPFHMTLTRGTKVYPVHTLDHQMSLETDLPFLTPSEVSCIDARNHLFDSVARAKRKAKRKTAFISNPDCAAKGVAPVRQYHKCDESKILPYNRLGIDLA